VPDNKKNKIIYLNAEKRCLQRTGQWLPKILCIVALCCAPALQAANQLLSRAEALEEHRDFSAAVEVYREYLLSPAAQGAEKRNVKLRLPVLQEALQRGVDPALDVFLQALDARASKDINAAKAALAKLATDFPDSYLLDDSAYLSGYIALMDEFDFADAAVQMRQLREQYPDSSYFDTALYCEAIAREQQGQTDSASQLLEQLKQRHTGFTIEWFNLSLPEDNYHSRYWHQRSSDRLAVIAAAHSGAATIIHRESIRHPDGYTIRLTVSADGRQYNLLLARTPTFNARSLGATERQKLMHRSSESLAGSVEGVAGSWARINIDNGNVTGMLSVHGDRVELSSADTSGSLSAYNSLLLSDSDGNPSSINDDTVNAPGELSEIDSYIRSLRGDRTTRATEVNFIDRVARIGVVVDSQFDAYYNGNGLQQALSVLNTADGIFRDEFGLALHIDKAIVITDMVNDPMRLGSVPIEQMMRNFRDYRNNSSILGSDIGLATLFTGNKNNDRPVGLAWIGTACRTDGYDVSVVTPFAQAAMLSVHEIAHTLGASHDSETACGETNYLMSRHLSNNVSKTFSSCSRDSIRMQLDMASCHADAADMRVELESASAQSLAFLAYNDSPEFTVPAATLRLTLTCYPMIARYWKVTRHCVSWEHCQPITITIGKYCSIRLSILTPRLQLLSTR